VGVVEDGREGMEEGRRCEGEESRVKSWGGGNGAEPGMPEDCDQQCLKSGPKKVCGPRGKLRHGYGRRERRPRVSALVDLSGRDPPRGCSSSRAVALDDARNRTSGQQPGDASKPGRQRQPGVRMLGCGEDAEEGRVKTDPASSSSSSVSAVKLARTPRCSANAAGNNAVATPGAC
jgi:hypothetical protein